MSTESIKANFARSVNAAWLVGVCLFCWQTQPSFAQPEQIPAEKGLGHSSSTLTRQRRAQLRFPAEVGGEKIRNPERYKKKQEEMRQRMQLNPQSGNSENRKLPYKIPEVPAGGTQGCPQNVPVRPLLSPSSSNTSGDVESSDEVIPGITEDESNVLDWSGLKPSRKTKQTMQSGTILHPPSSTGTSGSQPLDHRPSTYSNFLRELKERPLSELPAKAKVMRLVWFRESGNAACLRFDARFESYPPSLQGKLLEGLEPASHRQELQVRPRVTMSDSQFDQLFNQVANSKFWNEKSVVVEPTAELLISSSSQHSQRDNDWPRLVDKLVVETWSNSQHHIAVPSKDDPSIKEFLTKQLENAGLSAGQPR